MKHLFIPYELAVIAKEKGFDEPTITYYDIEEENNLKPIPSYEEINGFHCNRNSLMVASPLYQQILKWFKEKHFIHICPVYICSTNEIADFYYIINFMINEFKQKDIIIDNIDFDETKTLNKAIEEAFKFI